jgi:hypothetical protein
VVSTTPRLLYLWKRDTVPVVQVIGWASNSGWMDPENLAPTGVRTPDRPVRSKSLYRLRYPGRQLNRYILKKYDENPAIFGEVNKFQFFELRSDRHARCSLPGDIRWVVIGEDSRGCGSVGRSLNRLSGYPLYSSSSTGTWSFSLHTNCGGHSEVYLHRLEENKWARVTKVNTGGKERETMDMRQRNGRKNKRKRVKMEYCVISGFRHGVNEICAPLGFYAAKNDSFLRRFGTA